MLRAYGSCLVAYSGGVDSVFLARVAYDALGVRALGGEVTVLHQGGLLARGTFKEIEKNHEVRDVYLGRSA